MIWMIAGCVVVLLVVLEIRSWRKPEKLSRSFHDYEPLIDGHGHSMDAADHLKEPHS
jgi:hypothetical protein